MITDCQGNKLKIGDQVLVVHKGVYTQLDLTGSWFIIDDIKDLSAIVVSPTCLRCGDPDAGKNAIMWQRPKPEKSVGFCGCFLLKISPDEDTKDVNNRRVLEHITS